MRTTKMIIDDLTEQYLADKNYRKGIISAEWVDKVSKELKLDKLSFSDLSNMWDTIWLVLECESLYAMVNKEFDKAMQYKDVQSAFTEVVAHENKRRKLMLKEVK